MLEEHFQVNGSDKHLSYDTPNERMGAAVADGLKRDLLEQEDREKAAHVAKYLKTSDLRFLGIQIPQIRKTARKHIRGFAVKRLPQIIDILWTEEVFDFRLAAIEIMEKYSAKGD